MIPNDPIHSLSDYLVLLDSFAEVCVSKNILMQRVIC